MADSEDAGNRTPKQADATLPNSKGNSTIDPALRSEDSPGNASTPATKSDSDDKRQEDWIENIRTIETLRNWVKDRLSRGEYEAEAQQSAGGSDDMAASIAKLVEAKLKEELQAPVVVTSAAVEQDVKYPSLPIA